MSKYESREAREAARLAALDHLDATRPETDHVLQEIVDGVRDVFGVDLCLANLVFSDTLYFRAWSGELPGDLADPRRMPREDAPCRYVVEGEKPLIVEDLYADETTREEPVYAVHGVRFYAGAPLISSDGHTIGTLCLLNARPVRFDRGRMITLETFAKAIVGRLELLGTLHREREARGEIETVSRRNESILASAEEGVYGLDLEGNTTFVNPAAARMLGYEAEELVGRPQHETIRHSRPDGSLYPRSECQIHASLREGTVHRAAGEFFRRKDGSPFPVEYMSTPIREDGEMTGVVLIFSDITEREEAGRVLKESEERFRQLFDQSVDALLVHDSEGHIVDCNEEALRSLGYTREELLSMKVSGFATNLVSAREARTSDGATLWQRALGEDEPARAEERVHLGEHVRKDGKEFPVEVRVSGVDYDGERMILASARDVTERRAVERRLAAQHAVAATLAASTSISEAAPRILERICEELGWEFGDLWELDREAAGGAGRLRCAETWNTGGLAPEFEEQSRGLELAGGEGLPGRAWNRGEPVWVADILEDPTLPRLAAAREAGIRGGLAFPISVGDEFVGVMGFYTRETRREDVETLRMLSTMGGQIGQFFERKRAEAALRESEERYRAIVNTATEGIVIATAGSVIESFNPAAERIFGYSAEEAVGLPLTTLMPEGFRSLHGDGMRRYLNTRQARVIGSTVELSGLRKDGTEFPLELSISEIVRGDTHLFVGIIRDITERKKAEEALRESEARLRSVTSNAPIVLFQTDADGRFEFVTGKGLDALGIVPEDLIGVPVFEAFSESPDVLDAIGRAYGGEEFTAAVEIQGLTFETLYRPLWEEGGVTGLIGVATDVTERQRTESALRESEERYRTILQSIEDGYFETDLSGSLTFFNDALARILRYPPDELAGKNNRDYTDEENARKVYRAFNRIYETGEPLGNLEWELVSGGEHICVEASASRIEEESGEITGFRGLMRDITERRLREQEIRESSIRLSTLIESLQAGILVEDDARKVLHINGEFLQMFGIPSHPQEMIGADCSNAAEDSRHLFEEPEGFVRRISETLGLREPVVGEELALADGRILEQDYIPIFVDGEYRGHLWQYRDVTLHKREEEDLARLAAIVESSDEVIFSKTLEGYITSWNRAAERLYGYTPEEAVGQHISMLTSPEPPDEIPWILEKVRNGETIDHLETVRVSRSGEHLDVEITVSPIYGPSGEIVGASNIARDIRERKEAWEAVQWAREAAEEADRAKSDFLANMSHEIRTPMNGVIGMTDLLLDTDLDAEQREFTEAVRVSGENLLHIINDILDFSKIEAGALQLESVPFNLRSEVEEAVYLLAGRAHGRGLELTGFVEPEVPTAVAGDPFRLRQILTNLIGNAIKFTEHGEVGVRVVLEEEAAESGGRSGGVLARFEVTDTGLGLTPEQQAKLFSSFSQADTSTARRYGGTGLGLAICKQLAELMGGEIGVRSDPGASPGSTFWFTAHLGLREPDGTGETGEMPHDLRDTRILVVDDNATNRRILQRQISSWGLEATLAGSGEEALRLLRDAADEDRPHGLAILDHQMPGMDGLELASRIRSDPVFSGTRLVILTSMGLRGEGLRARETGITVHLTKPVRQSELYDALGTALGHRISRTPRSPERHETSITRSGEGRRLLLAEDNPVNQRVAIRMLEKLGYQIDLAHDGLEAIEKTGETSYDAVLMDCQMPEMDGYRATRELRRLEAEGCLPRLPVIAMTANALQGDRERALESGMDDYLTKPVKPAEIGAMLERWISRAPQLKAWEPSVYTDETPQRAEPADSANDSGMPITSLNEEVISGLRALQETGGPDILAEIIGMFLEDAGLRLNELREAAETGDPAALERAAHTLKGASGSVGAIRLSELSSELQEIGASGGLSRAQEKVEALQREFETVRPELESLGG